MKKCLFAALVLLVLLTSCATLKYFAGTVGDIYITTDDYSEEYATSEYDNDYYSFEDSLWSYHGQKSSRYTSGKKVLFYSDLDDEGFYNQLVPDRYRATSFDDAGFVIIAEEGEPVFYNDYTSSSSKCKVYYGTGVLKLYSIKTGKLLYTSAAVKGPTPPSQISVYAGTTSLTYDRPSANDFKSQISNICVKIASGKITGSVPDATTMEAAGAKVPAQSNDVLSIQGVWAANAEDTTIKLIFTDNGHLICEEWFEGECSGIDVCEYEFKDSVLTIDGYETEYFYGGKKLELETYSSDFQFAQQSKKAVERKGRDVFLGVWIGGDSYCSYTAGFTKDGFAIYQGWHGELTDYSADDEFFYAYGDMNPYYVIDDVLYFDDCGFFGEYATLRFEHVTKKGVDTTNKTNIINSNEITYVDENGETGNIYRFYNSGKFTDIPFDESGRYDQISGTYTYDDHILYLSDGRELSIAIIDDYYIGQLL